jgi:hypothetical protein
MTNQTGSSIVGDLTSETISIIYKECERPKNKRRLSYIINNITNMAFRNIQPYLYTIMAILIILFLMNCFQFYYYIKIVLLNNKHHINNTIAEPFTLQEFIN